LANIADPYFKKALAFVLPEEGGWSNVPGDNGGPTMEGIIQSEYDTWRREQGQPLQSVRNISDDERDEIYYDKYWIAGHCNGMPWPMAGVSFNIAVNAGIGEEIRVLKGVFGINDGTTQWTPALSNAIHTTMHPANMALAEITRMDGFYQYLASHYPHDAQFLRGWLNRDNAARQYFDLQS